MASTENCHLTSLNLFQRSTANLKTASLLRIPFPHWRPTHSTLHAPRPLPPSPPFWHPQPSPTVCVARFSRSKSPLPQRVGSVWIPQSNAEFPASALQAVAPWTAHLNSGSTHPTNSPSFRPAYVTM